jgi:hypothetical protein
MQAPATDERTGPRQGDRSQPVGAGRSGNSLPRRAATIKIRRWNPLILMVTWY